VSREEGSKQQEGHRTKRAKAMIGQVTIKSFTSRRLAFAFSLLVFVCLLGRVAAAQTVPQAPLFSQAVNYQPGSGGPSSIFLADVNGDGKLDVVVANQHGAGSNRNGSVSVLLGNGDGTLQQPVTYDSGGPGANSVFVVDVNGDGLPDIVVANQGGGSNGDGSVSVLLNGGGGMFLPAVTYDSGGPGANSVFVVDVNGDTLPDIVVANNGGESNGDGSVSVLLNGANGVSGTFKAAVAYDSGGVNATAVTLADVNGDGYPDILVGNYCFAVNNCPQQQGGVAILLNDKTGKFDLTNNYQTGGPTISIAVGDVNGDGIPDLFVGVSTYGAGFLPGEGSGGKGNGIFGAFQVVSGVQGQAVSVAVQDANGDGINDLLIGLGNCPGCDGGLGSGVTVLLGKGSGNYDSPVTLNTGGELAAAIGLGDLNGDKKPDLVVANQCDNGIIDNNCGGNVAVLLNSVNGITTTLTGSPNPAPTSQNVTYTATVSNPGGTPTGTVSFRDGTTVVAAAVPVAFNQALGLYQAVFSAAYAVVGTHQVTATYSLNQVSQISVPLSEIVANPAGTTTLEIMASPAVTPGTIAAPFGSVHFMVEGGSGQVTVTETGQLPTGMTYDSGLLSGTPMQAGNFPFTISASDTNGDTGNQQFTLTINPAISISRSSATVTAAAPQPATITITDNETITLTDTPSLPDIPDQETITLTDKVTVFTLPLTVTTVSSSNITAAVGASITFTAVVQSNSPGTPTGTITFFDGQTMLPATTGNPNPATLISGTASYTTSSLVFGPHLITAAYSGDVNFSGSISPAITQSMVNPAPAITTLSPSSTAAGGSGFTTITVNGTGFIDGATVNFNGSERSTTFLSATQLTALLVSSDIESAGWDQVTVSNPAPTVGVSNALIFQATSGTMPSPTGSVLNYVPVTPCRLVDTRTTPDGAFAGPSITGGTSRNFTIPSGSCNIPTSAAAYSLNVAVIPSEPLGYLTLWPAGQTQPVAATVSSVDGRVRSNAAIVPAGTSGAISVYASNTTNLVLDINGYFTTATTALEFYPVTPCRVVDTRNPNGPLGGPFLTGGTSRLFLFAQSSCNLPGSAQVYSLNVTAVPREPLGYLTTWPGGQAQPATATLSAPTGQVTSNAAIVGVGGDESINVFASNDTDLVIDVSGYFAPAGTGGLSLYTLPPCRVLDTRQTSDGQTTQPLSGQVNENIRASNCGVSLTAPVGAYVLNATVVPSESFGYLTMWPQGTAQPLAATLSALDATVTSNMAIVPTTGSSISMFASNPTQLVIDLFGYFAPP
jgi:hypothetical protein